MLILIDFQKALDTVNHSILLEKLSFYGIRGLSLKWFRSYLHEKKFHVSIGESSSEGKIYKYGSSAWFNFGHYALFSIYK